jgi:hypothetical protein
MGARGEAMSKTYGRFVAGEALASFNSNSRILSRNCWSVCGVSFGGGRSESALDTWDREFGESGGLPYRLKTEVRCLVL